MLIMPILTKSPFSETKTIKQLKASNIKTMVMKVFRKSFIYKAHRNNDIDVLDALLIRKNAGL